MPTSEERARYDAWWREAEPLFAQHDPARFRGMPSVAVDGAPWAAPAKPLAQARIALLSSGGLYLPPQPRYDDQAAQGDYTWRSVPLGADPAALRIAHTHYDHAAAEADLNTVYPLERLRELAAEGFIGGVSDPAYTWHGYVTDLARFRDEAAEALGERVSQDQPDAALLVPV